MKRLALTSPKIQQLADALQVPFYGAVGILELLWHFTAQNAPRGDVGRWSDEEIARAVRWPDCTSSVLISGLISSKFLDMSKKYRLVVHDWAEHCEQSVKRSAAVTTYGFCTATSSKLVAHQSETSFKLSSRVNGLARLLKEEDTASFDAFWAAYPRREGKGRAQEAFAKALLAKPAEAIIEAARAFAASPAGQRGRYTPHPATWLNQARYDDDRSAWQLTETEPPKVTGRKLPSVDEALA